MKFFILMLIEVTVIVPYLPYCGTVEESNFQSPKLDKVVPMTGDLSNQSRTIIKNVAKFGLLGKLIENAGISSNIHYFIWYCL